jgi:hypothetical protein
MTKRRAIYGTAATSLSLARCCPEAQLLFDRLVSQADDQGRLQGDPMLVKASCMPLIDRATTKAVDRWLGELTDQGMILRYESAGQPLLQIVRWWGHQDWLRHVYASRWAPPEGWDQDRTKGNGAKEDADNLPPDDGKVPPSGGQDAADSRQVAPLSGGGVRGESGDVSELEASPSRGGDAREADPPRPPPTELSEHSLSRLTTTHFDLTGKRCSPGGEVMYRDLLRIYGFEVVNRAQWNVGATDKADRGFIGRVKTQCKKVAA